MRKLFLVNVLIFTFAIKGFCQDIEGIEESKKLGLVSYLTFVKSIGESQMTILASNVQFKTESEETKRFKTNYNLLKLSVDKLINQMSADLYLRNRLRLYRDVNQFVKNPENTLRENQKQYQVLLEEIDGRLSNLIFSKYSSMAGASLEEITAIVSLGHDIIAGAREYREKKVQSITGLLKELKLESLKDLIDAKEEEEG